MQVSCTSVFVVFRISFSFLLMKQHVPFLFFILNSQRYHPSFYEKYLSLEAREKELIKNVLLIAEKNGEIKNNMNLLLVSDMFYNSYSGLLFYSSFHPTDDFEKKLLMLFENVYSLIKVDS